MKKLVDLLISERLVVAAIILNTVALFFLAAAAAEERIESLWFLIDYGCVVFFLLEAILKIGRFGWKGYWTSNWNRFDLMIVVLSLPVLLAPVIDLHSFAFVLALRVGRLFRLFRLLRFIPNGAHMAEGISRALKASVGVFLALVLINIVLSIGATMLFGSIAPELFGNPLMSVYSTFRVFTIEGWYEIPDLLASRAEFDGMAIAARVYFVISVLVGGILGLSLANAVFVDQMTMDNTDTLEAKVDHLTEQIDAIRSELRDLGQPERK